MLERETGLEPARFCLGSVELLSAVARAWSGERKQHSQGVVTTDEIAARLEPRYPAVATMLTEARGELTAVTAFPVSHWRNIWSANPLERVN
jgi:putative transposase